MSPILPLVRHLTVFKARFNRAKRLGLLRENPTDIVKTPKVNNVIVRYVSPFQEAGLLERLPIAYHAIAITAMKREQLRLTLSDVDWNGGVLTGKLA